MMRAELETLISSMILACAKALTSPSFACKCSFLCAHTIMRNESRYIITYTYTYKKHH